MDRALSDVTHRLGLVLDALSPLPDIAEEADSALLAALDETSHGWRAWERALRDRRAVLKAGVDAMTVRTRLGTQPAWSVAVWCAVSMQRDGHLREHAVRLLSACNDRVALAALINRTADPVPQIAVLASTGLTRLITRTSPDDLVWALPLIDAMAGTLRGAQSILSARIAARLRAQPAAFRRALTRAASSPDLHLRLSAAQHQSALPGTAEQRAQTLDTALRDGSPILRRWAAEEALQRCEPPHLAPLLATMTRFGGPRLRLMALRVRRREGDVDALRQACFDGNANVRFYARRYLRVHEKGTDFRALAWALLDARASSVAQKIGALSVLSEFGEAGDRDRIEAWTTGVKAKVAAEARRTLELLPG